MRRVIQGTRSDKGLENHSVLRSLLETARRQGKKLHLFLHDLFVKEPRSPGRPLQESTGPKNQAIKKLTPCQAAVITR